MYVNVFYLSCPVLCCPSLPPSLPPSSLHIMSQRHYNNTLPHHNQHATLHITSKIDTSPQHVHDALHKSPHKTSHTTPHNRHPPTLPVTAQCCSSPPHAFTEAKSPHYTNTVTAITKYMSICCKGLCSLFAGRCFDMFFLRSIVALNCAAFQ